MPPGRSYVKETCFIGTLRWEKNEIGDLKQNEWDHPNMWSCLFDLSATFAIAHGRRKTACSWTGHGTELDHLKKSSDHELNNMGMS
jgi:hypothetical protein